MRPQRCECRGCLDAETKQRDFFGPAYVGLCPYIAQPRNPEQVHIYGELAKDNSFKTP